MCPLGHKLVEGAHQQTGKYEASGTRGSQDVRQGFRKLVWRMVRRCCGSPEGDFQKNPKPIRWHAFKDAERRVTVLIDACRGLTEGYVENEAISNSGEDKSHTRRKCHHSMINGSAVDDLSMMQLWNTGLNANCGNSVGRKVGGRWLCVTRPG